MSCGYSQEALFMYLDGAMTEQAQQMAVHIAGCSQCAGFVAAHKASTEQLVSLVDRGVGDVDPLMALSKIHARIKHNAEQSFLYKLKAAWTDLVTFHKKAVWGVAAAMALGALLAPAVVLWANQAAQKGGRTAAFASVVIESMQVEGNARTVVYQGEGGTTTLIWVEPSHDGASYH